jgi:uncharacterized protein (DUF488 family)
MTPLATIGYEGCTIPSLLDTLQAAGVQLVVDVRAVTSSRRPGFSKNRLAENLSTVRIGYLHLRGLGTPAEGRAAARAGRYDELRTIFGEHMETLAAQADLEALAELVRAGRRVCLLCYEHDPAHCHRTMVAEALQPLVRAEVRHLSPVRD